MLLKQWIAIPMGIDPALFWVNHLYAYEYEFIKLLMYTNQPKANRYRYATYFIDDECNLNNEEEFGKSFHLIHPYDLDLKCEHQGVYGRIF